MYCTCTWTLYKSIFNSLAQNTVRFSFSVQFKTSDVAWASRWDTYLRMSDVQIHWFAICNSVAIVLFLTGMSCDYHMYIGMTM